MDTNVIAHDTELYTRKGPTQLRSQSPKIGILRVDCSLRAAASIVPSTTTAQFDSSPPVAENESRKLTESAMEFAMNRRVAQANNSYQEVLPPGGVPSQAEAPEALQGLFLVFGRKFLAHATRRERLGCQRRRSKRSFPAWSHRSEKDRNADELSGTSGGKVLTLSRQLGAGDTGFAPTLAARIVRFFPGEHHRPGERALAL